MALIPLPTELPPEAVPFLLGLMTGTKPTLEQDAVMAWNVTGWAAHTILTKPPTVSAMLMTHDDCHKLLASLHADSTVGAAFTPGQWFSLAQMILALMGQFFPATPVSPISPPFTPPVTPPVNPAPVSPTPVLPTPTGPIIPGH
jgi:hypothetical protein